MKKCHLIRGLVGIVGLACLAITAQGRPKENVKMINKTGKECKVEVFGGENHEKTIDDSLAVGESGTVQIEWCPTKFKANCGGQEYEDSVTCAELDGDGALDVTFK